MSSEIYYDRAFIKIGEEQFIPVANHGSSNTFDFDLRGREIPEKHWSVLNYPHWDKFVFTVAELQEVTAVYEEANTTGAASGKAEIALLRKVSLAAGSSVE